MLEGDVHHLDTAHCGPIAVFPTSWVSFENEHSKTSWLLQWQTYVLVMLAYSFF